MYIMGVGLMRKLQFKSKEDENLENAAIRLSEYIITMTGDWLYHVSCEGIEKLIDSGKFSFVYFGQLDDLYGGKMDHLKKVIAFDRFTFFDERVYFYFNDDKECAKARQFDQEKPAVALYLGKDTLPFSLTEESEMSYDYLVQWISSCIVEFNMKWG